MSFPKLGIFLLLLPCAFAASQAQTGNTFSKHGLEVFGGYSYLDVNIKTSGGGVYIPSGSGFNAGLDVRMYRPVSLVGEVSVFSTPCSCARGMTFVFGPRYLFPVPGSFKLRPFAGVLIGASTYNHTVSSSYGYVYSNNAAFAYDFQGGLDYRLTPRFAIRGVGA